MPLAVVFFQNKQHDDGRQVGRSRHRKRQADQEGNVHAFEQNTEQNGNAADDKGRNFPGAHFLAVIHLDLQVAVHQVMRNCAGSSHDQAADGSQERWQRQWLR